MVDWEVVDKLRSKGWDWDRIATDPKVGFQAEEAAGEPGRALRTLYYQRRSRQKRHPTTGAKSGETIDERKLEGPRWNLARVGFFATPLFLIWFLLAYAYPSPVGVYVVAFPVLVFILVVAIGVLCFGLLRATEKWNKSYRTTAIVGGVAGLVVAGGFGLAGIAAGCPSLVSSVGPEPNTWEKASNPTWKVNGATVVFFYGSIACPYCSASSWAIMLALQRFGSLTPINYGYSTSNDVYPHTPEVILSGTTLTSQYLSWDVAEATDPNAITQPTVPGCTEQAYVSSYDNGGSIPFVVVGGQYFHIGTMIPTNQMSQFQGLTAGQVQGQLSNQSGPIWNIVSVQAYWLTAFMVKANGGQPSNVATDPNIAPLLAQIT